MTLQNMLTLPVQIVRFIDKSQPGWVECLLCDANGRKWILADKVPIFTEKDLDANSPYPQPGAVACEILRRWADEHGRERCIVSTEEPWDVEAIGGETKFEVFVDQITRHVN